MKNYQYSRVARAVAQALGNHSGLVGCALLAAGGTAWAQDNQAGEGTIDTVVVSGYRASLQNSIADKKDADQIVEAISAEDIGKLPDNSIAESIARVPGLTTQRLDGRAQVISIRGLAPDFSTTLLNGREQVTTGDNRSAEYDQYPSEVVGTVLVYKTPEAGLIGQGLSGTVDLQTIRPLEYGRRTLAANLRGERLSLGDLNAGSKEDGYRVSGTYVDQFADDRVGISVGVAYMDSPTQVERFNSWGYPGVTDGVVMGGAKPYVVSTELKRTGVIGTLEFAPSDTFTTSVDLYYSKFEDEQLLRGIELPLLWGGASLQPGYTTENGLVTEGVYTGVKAVVRNDANLREAELWSAGWNGKLDLGSWKLEGDLNFSTVDREDTILETYSGTGRAGVGATDDLGFNQSVDEGDATFSSSLDYSDPNVIFLTSPQGWGGNAIQGGQDGFINNPSIDDELTAFRLSAGREFGNVLFRNVEIGANYTLRDKTYRPDRYYLGLVGNTDGNTSIPIPQDALLRPTELEFLGISGMVSYDPLALAYGGMYNFVPAVDANVFSRNWAIEENVLTGYAQLGIEMDVGESVLSGNLGVQIVQTDQTSDGVGAANVPNAPFGTPAVVTPVSVEQDYTEALPSLNLSIRMPNDLVTRIGFARQMARPRMDDMRPSLEFTYDANRADETDINQSPWGGSGGNPNLRPWVANAVDLSVEKYYGREGYVAGAVFYKDLRSYIYNQPQLYDFTDFPITTGDDPVLRQGFVTTPQNGTGGKIYGYEIAGSLPFNTFAEALDGFGVIGSYSFTKSDISDPNSPSRPLPGLSEDVVSGTVYFEKFGFSARASVRHRSAFLGEVQGVGAERLLRSARAETLIDAQISYDFQFGNLEGLSVILQGYNLTDEPFVTTELNNNNLVIDHQTFGRRYLLGVSVKY